MNFPEILAPFSDEINYNPQIMDLYLNILIPSITERGDDKNYGSACLLDVTLLQVPRQMRTITFPSCLPLPYLSPSSLSLSKTTFLGHHPHQFRKHFWGVGLHV
jgi:hypothetical protein